MAKVLRISPTGALALFCLALAVSPSAATPINYGDFDGPTVMYIDVTEDANSPDDTPPLFGAPTLVGDTLDFNPIGFEAAVDGTFATDDTKGTVQFTVMAKSPGVVLQYIAINEGGVYDLDGAGTVATAIGYDLSLLDITVLEVDGHPLATPTPLGDAAAMGGDTLIDGGDSGTPWNLGLFYDIEVALIAAKVDYLGGATKLQISIENNLLASAEPGSLASIVKHNLVIRTIPLPEPSSLVLAVIAMLSLGTIWRPRNPAP